MAKYLRISCLLSLARFVKCLLFDDLHLLLSPFLLSASHSGKGSCLPVGLSHTEIPPGSFPRTLSFPPASFSFDLKVPDFPSQDLPHLSWKALATWFGFSLEFLPSFLIASFLPETFWAWAKSSCTGALPCCQRTLLQAISSCRQLALPWNGVCSIHALGCIQLSHIQPLPFRQVHFSKETLSGGEQEA